MCPARTISKDSETKRIPTRQNPVPQLRACDNTRCSRRDADESEPSPGIRTPGATAGALEAEGLAGEKAGSLRRTMRALREAERQAGGRWRLQREELHFSPQDLQLH